MRPVSGKVAAALLAITHLARTKDWMIDLRIVARTRICRVRIIRAGGGSRRGRCGHEGGCPTCPDLH